MKGHFGEKREICINISRNTGIGVHEVNKYLNFFFGFIYYELTRYGKSRFKNFGCFKVIDKKSRTGRNFKKNESLIIAPRRVVTFKYSNFLKEIMKSKEEINFELVKKRIEKNHYRYQIHIRNQVYLCNINIDILNCVSYMFILSILEMLLSNKNEEKKIELRNFGIFYNKRRKSFSRNPKTGEVFYNERNLLSFKPSKILNLKLTNGEQNV